MYLLDVNVLIALLDQVHPHHDRAKVFFRTYSARGWATCPITENGALRILGNPTYPGGPGSSEGARVLLTRLITMPGHRFWPDDLSLVNGEEFPRLPSSKHLTDHYLLALAASRQARLATFDRNMDTSLLPGGTAAYFLIS